MKVVPACASTRRSRVDEAEGLAAPTFRKTPHAFSTPCSIHIEQWLTRSKTAAQFVEGCAIFPAVFVQFQTAVDTVKSRTVGRTESRTVCFVAGPRLLGPEPFGPNTNHVLANRLAVRFRYTSRSSGYPFTDP